jgi:cation transport regulator ChaC
MWIFGYGSLVWKPEPDSTDMRPGYIRGYERRFYQGSPDHRGTPESPGRVLTLVESPDYMLWGRAYEVPKHNEEEFMARLDHREKAGYSRQWLPVYEDPHGQEILVEQALVYIGGPNNPDFIGSASIDQMAKHIARSEGPSGPNPQYLLNIANELRHMGVEEPHIEKLASRVRQLLGGE